MTSRDREPCTAREILLRAKKLYSTDPLAADVLINAAVQVGMAIIILLVIGAAAVVLGIAAIETHGANIFVSLGIAAGGAIIIWLSTAKASVENMFTRELLNQAAKAAREKHLEIAREIAKM